MSAVTGMVLSHGLVFGDACDLAFKKPGLSLATSHLFCISVSVRVFQYKTRPVFFLSC